MAFWNREQELAALRQIQARAERRSQFTLVLGRRRMGKTTLIREFLRDVPRALYFFVTRKRSEDLRAEFAEVLAQEQPALAGERLSWDALLRACFDAARHDPLTVVFDEFQTFRYVDPSVFSILQKHWDTLHGERRVHLLAVGSLMTLMERIFTGAKEPLARRATAQIRVDPFSPAVVEVLVRRAGHRGTREFLRYWTVLGGCPKYYALAADAGLLGEDVLQAVDALVLQRDAILRAEGRTLLVEEFGREHTTAFSILRAIASGRGQVGEIADVTGYPVTGLPKELRRLQDEYQLIVRDVPIGAAAGRVSRYRLRDQFLTFWFRYVYPFESQLEAGRRERVLGFIRRDLSTLEGWTFEEMIRQRIAEGDPALELPFDAHEVGRWWSRQGHEIDVVARTKGGEEVFFGECKLSADRVQPAVLHALAAQVDQVPWRQRARRVHLGLFTIGRVNSSVRAAAKAAGITLWEL